MGILTKVILQFNEKYNGLAKIDFEPQEIDSSIEYSSGREKRLLNERISNLLSKQKVLFYKSMCKEHEKTSYGLRKYLQKTTHLTKD